MKNQPEKKMSSRYILIAACALSAGCASTKLEQLEPGTTAVVAARHAPDSNFNTYAHGRGANAGVEGLKTGLKGAAAGALAPIAIGGGVGGPIGLVIGVLAAPIGAAIGGVIGGTVGLIKGAVDGMPADQVQAIHQPVERARADAAIQQVMAQRIAALGTPPTHRLIYLPDLGPASPRQTPDYEVLKAAEFDSVLELAVTSIGFEATKGNPPSATFVMALRARVVPLRGEGRPWVREWTHRGTWRPATEWQADDGTLFQEELEASYLSLARSVAGAMLVSPLSPVDQ